MNTWSTQNRQGGERLKTKGAQLCGRQSEHYGTGYQLFEVDRSRMSQPHAPYGVET